MPALITERFSDPQWDRSLSGVVAARVFDVSGATTPKDAIKAVRDAIVDINDEHEDQTGLLCNAVRLVSVLGPFYYRISAVYAVPPNGIWVITDDADDPFSLPPVLRFERTLKSRPVDKDLGGIPYVNSAGDPFIPNSERNTTCRILHYTRYEPTWNLAIADAYEGAVNSDTLYLGPLKFNPGQVFCHTIEPAEDFPLDATKLRIVYVLEFDRTSDDPFQVRLIDKGTNGWFTGGSGVGTKKGQICFANGDPVQNDVLLDGTGKPVDTTLKVLDNNGNPVAAVANPSVSSYWKTESATPGKVLLFKEAESLPFMALGL